jgi:hypothetical protein
MCTEQQVDPSHEDPRWSRQGSFEVQPLQDALQPAQHLGEAHEEVHGGQQGHRQLHHLVSQPPL